MQCLMCQKEMNRQGRLSDILYREDLLCRDCRGSWERMTKRYRLKGIPVVSLYVYNHAFAQCLLQYKECHDEALADVFLYPDRDRLQRQYRGYTLLLMPSTHQKIEARGFNHLEKMYSCLGLPMMDCFEKCVVSDQTNKSRAQRLEMARAIRLKEHTILPKKILLADDVLTTGATLSGALSCLDPSEHTIRILTVSAAVAKVA